jgi:hypothetical protein
VSDQHPTSNIQHPTPKPAGYENIATSLLRDMLNRNLALAGRMLDIGDCASAKRLLQSAISQCDQIASYHQPPTKTETTIEI